ncbi:MAG TPA: cyclic pyranopterin monophosphate synthase MoaC [Pyrinomonadaceae bacterium]|jgi:cyclic pyranopterin phosphate synthase
MKKLTHFDEAGKAVMVDVGEKAETKRRAVASARVLLNGETISAIKNNQTPKGNPLEIARIAGIMAAKQTANLIPLCHQINLSKVEIRAELTDYGVSLESEAITTAQTGVEMEALTAVSVAALTVYDMCKALDKTITITDVRLEAKTGGKSGDFERAKIED